METSGALEIRFCNLFLRKLAAGKKFDVDMLAYVFHCLTEYAIHRQLSRPHASFVTDPRCLATLFDVHFHERLQPRCLVKANDAVNFRQVKAKPDPQFEKTVMHDVLFDLAEMRYKLLRTRSAGWKVFFFIIEIFLYT